MYEPRGNFQTCERMDEFWEKEMMKLCVVVVELMNLWICKLKIKQFMDLYVLGEEDMKIEKWIWVILFYFLFFWVWMYRKMGEDDEEIKWRRW